MEELKVIFVAVIVLNVILIGYTLSDRFFVSRLSDSDLAMNFLGSVGVVTGAGITPVLNGRAGGTTWRK